MSHEFQLTEEIKDSWKPIIEAEGVTPITDATVKNNTIRLLENTKREMSEATVSADGGGAAASGYDPVLISMVRRLAPSLISNEIVGVQPMSGPTGLVFALHSWYGGTSGGTESNTSTEPDSTFAAKAATAAQEALGSARHVNTADAGAAQDPVAQTNPWPEMSFSIDKTTVTADSRALKAKYTIELAQDLKAIHGLDAETELANILSGEVTAEMNREMIQLITSQAKFAGKSGTHADLANSTFDVSSTGTDSDGRWTVENYKNLLIWIQRQAATIALETRRGIGNFIITSANVAGALDMASKIDTSLVSGSLMADGVGVTFAGVLAGRFKVYVDPYMLTDIVIVGYKGPNVYDAGVFFAPYVPLTMMKAIGEEDFQPRLGFKTRYGIGINPFAPQAGNNANPYYRAFTVTNL